MYKYLPNFFQSSMYPFYKNVVSVSVVSALFLSGIGSILFEVPAISAEDEPSNNVPNSTILQSSFPIMQKTPTASASIVPQKQKLFRKWADRSEVLSGGQIRFTLRLQNTTQKTMRELSISDRFDPSLLKITSNLSSAAEEGNGHILWHVPVLMPGDVWEVSYVLHSENTVPHGATLSTIATLEGDMVAHISLEDRVQVIKVRVLAHLPKTGVSLDMFFMMFSTGILGLVVLGHRKLAL